MSRRVVITGIGPVTSVGVGKEDFFKNVMDKNMKVKVIPEEYHKGYTFKSKYYVPIPHVKLEDYGISKMYEKIMDISAKLTVVATKLAIQDAGYKIEQDGKKFKVDGLENAGILLGVGFTNLEVAFSSYESHMGMKDRKSKYNRMIIPMMMTNSPASWTSILFGIKGFNYTVNAACASGTYAIGEAYSKIMSGQNDVIISGGVEVLKDDTGATMRGFDLLKTLTKSKDGIPRPFSHDRSGFLYNDGASCMMILEEYEHAKKRGANMYAEIVDYKSNSDAYSIAQINPSGEKIREIMYGLSKDERIDYMNAHGTGTVSNDEIEAQMINEIFGEKRNQPYINSSKGILGHSIGASGALEAAITAMSIKSQKIHGNLTENPFGNLNLNLDTIETNIEYALSLSYGFGGHNAGILLKKV